ncbi:MAG: tetratricopeptide repeat protein, partial [Terriglobales bacterium]
LYRGNDRPQQAIEQFKEVLRLSPSSAAAYVNMATCYIALGQFSEGQRYWEEAFKIEPSWITNGNLNHEYGFTLIHAGNEAKAREVFEKALAFPDLRPRGLRSFAYLDLLHGRYHDAKPRLQEALLLDIARKTALSELREHNLVGMAYEGLGDRASQLRELDQALPLLSTLQDKIRAGLWLGIPYARNGAVAKAAQILEAMKPVADFNNPVQASDVHLLEGEVELARGNKDHAIELLLLADREKSSGLTLVSLARAYQLAGDTEQAIRWNEVLLAVKHPPFGWEAQQDWIAAHVHLAKLYLARGERDKAAARLNEFFTLWKDADPDLPLLKEAQRLQKEVAR